MPDLDHLQRRSPRRRLVGHLVKAVGPVPAWWSGVTVTFAMVSYQATEQVHSAVEYAGLAGIFLSCCLVLDLCVGGGVKRWRTNIRLARSLGFESRIRSEKQEGRIVTAADLSPEHAVLLARAQSAIRCITGSAVNQAGLLDSLDNAFILREQEWEIAWRLAQISLLEDGHGSLQEAVDSVQNRVEALEAYACHVAEADLAHRAQERLDAALAARPSVVQDLLAETARDHHAVKQIQRLDEHARTLCEAIRADLAPKAPGW
ncbi:hypothetical protein [Streptosporangium amethystogenes]|uniref:hypothetical protein n=1 Tax=Streptosporangium amethystogenes TaxID=2002 RepID=UPI0004C656B2|nr:hypothetical protein [Streptosporangium amethystogenes]